jgi:hypothetical protein
MLKEILGSRRILSALFLGLCLLAAAWFRVPRISEGLPFFYREDEAHHFNRLVNMVQSGDLNPHYFHKPSLHFYLRIPVLAASFIQSVRKGQIRSVKEIVTHDPYGVGGYAFSASHPGLVKGNRAFSVLLSICFAAFAFFITKEVTESPAASGIAALLAAVSPALIEDSAVIGVDVVMGFFCLATTYFSIRLIKNYSFGLLVLSALCAGLAVSSKYNALPIVAAPLLAALFAKRLDAPALVTALVVPAVGFILGTPFLLTSLPVFLDQLAYEVWHYGVAAHEGHNAEPGLPQAMFYLRWLNNDGLGPIATAFGTVGIITLFSRKLREHLVLLSFPLLFALLMISQRTNFTRNMLVIVPYLCITAALTIFTICELLNLGAKTRAVIYALFVILSAWLPTERALEARASVGSRDSRLLAVSWLHQNQESFLDTAIQGQLQFPAATFDAPGVSRIDSAKAAPSRIALSGFDRLLLSPGFELNPSDELIWRKEMEFQGIKQIERIVDNPGLIVWRFQPNDEGWRFLTNLALEDQKTEILLDPALPNPGRCSTGTAAEPYCWIQDRVTSLRIAPLPRPAEAGQPITAIKLSFSVMSPWPSQTLTFSLLDWSRSLKLDAPGQWQGVELEVPYDLFKAGQKLALRAGQVHSPKTQGLNADQRRLGCALKFLDMKGL